jgi:hypothetical protein
MGVFSKESKYKMVVCAGELNIEKELSSMPAVDLTDDVLTIEIEDEYFLTCSLDLEKGHYFYVSREN